MIRWPGSGLIDLPQCHGGGELMKRNVRCLNPVSIEITHAAPVNTLKDPFRVCYRASRLPITGGLSADWGPKSH